MRNWSDETLQQNVFIKKCYYLHWNFKNERKKTNGRKTSIRTEKIEQTRICNATFKRRTRQNTFIITSNHAHDYNEQRKVHLSLSSIVAFLRYALLWHNPFRVSIFSFAVRVLAVAG